jgi:hypothetical protein
MHMGIVTMHIQGKGYHAYTGYRLPCIYRAVTMQIYVGYHADGANIGGNKWEIGVLG